MKGYVVLLVLFFHLHAFAQNNAITGVVIDAETQFVIPGCNVFISNTSMGKISDKEGKFNLYDIPASKSHELVVSCVGYETFAYTFASAALPLNLRITLNKKVIEMQNVQIVPLEIDGWAKWGNLFQQYFIGQSENSRHCKIMNTEVIEFRRYKAQNSIEATSNQLLVIRNARLGYIIKYQLESFTYNFKTNLVSYSGYPLFEEMEPGEKVAAKFIRRRQKAYNGSLMHFIRSLYNNTLSEEGFEARRMIRHVVNDTFTLKERKMTLYIFDSAGNKKEMPDGYVKKRTVETVSTSTLTTDSILFGGKDKVKDIWSFNNFLSVRYVREKEPPEYSNFFHRAGLGYQLSNFTITNDDKSILVLPAGNYYPSLDLLIEGFMGWEKIGDLLPLDYGPVEQGAPIPYISP